MELLTIALYILAFFTDTCIALAVGYKLGPERARRLICTDPEYVQTRETLQAVQRDMLTVRHDFEAQRDTVLQAMRGLEKTVIESIKALPKPEFSATMQLPVTMQDAVQRDIRAVVRSVTKEVVTSDLQGMLDAAVQKAVDKHLTPANAEEASKLADEAELAAYLDQVAGAYGIPGPVVSIAKRMGRAAIPWLDARYNLGLQEVSR